ncbi:MAG TPA: hypothetical protein VMS98_00980 [Thermoanaerobaculia bacterium]|nr:hypothetical protein [Thermoanaerobaculia bacterium]
MKRLFIVFFVLLAACGKRGDPRPPVPMIPQATSDLAASQRATRIVLTWTYPSVTTAGKSLTGIRSIAVHRWIEELPPAATMDAAAAAEPAVTDAIAQFAKIPTLTPTQFVKLSERVDSMEGAKLADATVGDQIRFEDRPEFRSASGRPRRITYAVITESLTATSDVSNLATIVPLDVAVAPFNVRAEATVDGVTLSWEAPQRAATGAPVPVLIGYNVYRDAGTDLSRPVNATPVTATTFTDAPPYGDHTYQVTAVASSGPPRVESEASATATVTFKDLVPPPAPQNVLALVETQIARVVWDPVNVPDLAGYRVYRYEGTGRIKLTLGPIPGTFFGDESVSAGITYNYAITAVDTSGNESAEGKSQPFLVPKTP